MIIKKSDVKDKNRISEVFHIRYMCDWCFLEFERKVASYSPVYKKQRLSDQVHCPRCDNFIKSFE